MSVSESSPAVEESDKKSASAAAQPPRNKASETAGPEVAAGPANPLRWFGILLPPALRTAQSTFTSAVEEPVPRLASLSKELRKLEMDIGRIRKQLRKSK